MLEEIKKEFDKFPIKKILYDTDEGQTFIAELIAVDKRNLWQFIKQKLTEAGKQNRIEFNRGYICAVSNVLRLYDEPTLAEEVYKQNFFNIRGLREMGVDEQDIQLLKPIIKEIERKNRINELKGDE